MGEVIKVVVGITICLFVVKSCLTTDLDEKPAEFVSNPAPASISTPGQSAPELKSSSGTKPDEKTVYMNLRKGEPPVAITCREVGGQISCKPAK